MKLVFGLMVFLTTVGFLVMLIQGIGNLTASPIVSKNTCWVFYGIMMTGLVGVVVVAELLDRRARGGKR